MIKAVVFDADGMLVNGDKFSEALVRDYDVDREKEKEFFTTTFQDCLVGEADLKESITPYLPSLGWTGTADELLEYWFTTEHAINEDLVAYIGKLQTNGTRVALATNQEKYRTDYMLDRMGFREVFDTIYSSAHLGVKKPSQEFFAKIVEDLGVDKQEVVFWDDDQINVEGAAAYGIHAEFYKDFDSFLVTMASQYGFPRYV